MQCNLSIYINTPAGGLQWGEAAARSGEHHAWTQDPRIALRLVCHSHLAFCSPLSPLVLPSTSWSVRDSSVHRHPILMDAFPRCPESTLIFRKFLYECAGPGHFPGLWGCWIRHYEAPATRPVARQARELQVSRHAHTCFHKSVLLCCCVPRMSVLMLQVKASGWAVFGVLDPLATKCVNRHVHKMFEESASTDHTEVSTICVQLPLLMECCSSCPCVPNCSHLSQT